MTVMRVWLAVLVAYVGLEATRLVDGYLRHVVRQRGLFADPDPSFSSIVELGEWGVWLYLIWLLPLGLLAAVLNHRVRWLRTRAIAPRVAIAGIAGIAGVAPWFVLGCRGSDLVPPVVGTAFVCAAYAIMLGGFERERDGRERRPRKIRWPVMHGCSGNPDAASEGP